MIGVAALAPPDIWIVQLGPFSGRAVELFLCCQKKNQWTSQSNKRIKNTLISKSILFWKQIALVILLVKLTNKF